MRELEVFLGNHAIRARRFFLRSTIAMSSLPSWLSPASCIYQSGGSSPLPGELQDLVRKLGPYFTPQKDFRDISRGKPVPHSLDENAKRRAGLTRETWKLEVISDPENPVKMGNPLTLDFDRLMRIGSTCAVRFPKLMTCLNIGTPLGMGIWEGVPLREIVWMAKPTENLRRVHYWGFHNNDPKQQFRSSLPVGRVLEDPFDFPPVILAYKLNGEWLTSERGGPVRVVVPEAYGFKSVKWISHVVLSNLFHANDTYANGNNDIDSPMKTFAATLQVPDKPKAGEMLPITGYAQVGFSGLRKVQVSIHRRDHSWPPDDPWFDSATWKDATVLGAPGSVGANLPGGRVPLDTMGFESRTGLPASWPPRFGLAHWAILMPGLPQGDYTLRCRTIDEKGAAQPRPRPFQKSGHAAIEQVDLTVL